MPRSEFDSYEDTRGDHWADQAACKGLTFELFEYQEKDSPLAVGMKTKERLSFNSVNFALGEEVCIECPVFFQCRDEATEEEKFWTMRGGEPPGRFIQEKESWDRQMAGLVKGGDTCSRGHERTKPGRCMVCKREGQRAARAARRAAGLPVKY